MLTVEGVCFKLLTTIMAVDVVCRRGFFEAKDQTVTEKVQGRRVKNVSDNSQLRYSVTDSIYIAWWQTIFTEGTRTGTAPVPDDKSRA